jgi:hypothetical protein
LDGLALASVERVFDSLAHATTYAVAVAKQANLSVKKWPAGTGHPSPALMHALSTLPKTENFALLPSNIDRDG